MIDLVIDSGVIMSIILGVLTYNYDRCSRYNYLASRWNDLMNINFDEPDFFKPKETIKYDSFNDVKKTKYNFHARMYWGFVEDVIRKDYFFEKSKIMSIVVENFTDAYHDTIRETIFLHHTWLSNNKNELFVYSKFRKELKKEFSEELREVDLQL